MASVEAAAGKRTEQRQDVSKDLVAARQALAESRDENAALKETTDEVLRRLDDVIARLRAVLEE